jgi:hypothetical protein
MLFGVDRAAAGLTLRKLSEDATTITLGWDPVAGIGYRFTRSAANGRYSHTWDPTRSSARFSKDSGWYAVEAMGLSASGVYPPPPVTAVPRAGISFGSKSLFRSDADHKFELDQVQAVGAKALRFDVKSEWFSQCDRMVNSCLARGIEPSLTLGGQMNGYSGNTAWQALVAAIRDRYVPRGVRLFETPNEPNLTGWNVADLANAIVIANSEIHKAPGTILAAGGLALPATAMLQWTKDLYAAGIAGHFDVFSVHAYDDPAEHGSWSAWDCTFGHPTFYPGGNNIVGVMAAHGDNVPIWSTESGGPTPKYSLDKQAQIAHNVNTDPRPQMALWYTALDDDVPGFGLLDTNRQPRPAYAAFKNSAQ